MIRRLTSTLLLLFCAWFAHIHAAEPTEALDTGKSSTPVKNRNMPKKSLPANRDKTVAMQFREHPGIQSACTAATNSGDPILVVFTASWCGACQVLKKETLDSETFRTKAGPIHMTTIDIDADEQTARLYRVNAVPKLVLITAEQAIYAEEVGFMSPEDLLKWISNTRKRIKSGAVLGDPAFSTTHTTISDYINALPARDKQIRQAASFALVRKGHEAIEPLLAAMDNEYLGTRLAAYETLRIILPSLPAWDPWEEKAIRSQKAATIRTWWETNKDTLSIVNTPVTSDHTVEKAFKDLSGQDPFIRTEAIGILKQAGDSILPRIRDELEQATKDDRQHVIHLLKTIRWSILIPDDIERAYPMRLILAHGQTDKRISAIKRLGTFGDKATPALSELVLDPDAAIQEAVASTLRQQGSSNSIKTLALLLKSWNSNTRAIAAQELGHTKNKAAAPYLATVTADPDDIVACTAITALEEINAKEEANTLRKCLEDERWRVRAAALKTINKMELKQLKPDIMKCLDDSDSFVVTCALETLSSLNIVVPPERLFELSKKYPDLMSNNIKILFQHTPSMEEMNKLTAMLKDLEPENKKVLVNAVFENVQPSGRFHGSREMLSMGPTWKPFLTEALSSTDPDLLMSIAKGLESAHISEAEPYLVQLLSSPQQKVVDEATNAILIHACYAWHAIEEPNSNNPEWGALYRLAQSIRPAEKTSDEQAVASQPEATTTLVKHQDGTYANIKSIGIIGGADGPTAIYLADSGEEISADQMHRLMSELPNRIQANETIFTSKTIQQPQDEEITQKPTVALPAEAPSSSDTPTEVPVTATVEAPIDTETNVVITSNNLPHVTVSTSSIATSDTDLGITWYDEGDNTKGNTLPQALRERLLACHQALKSLSPQPTTPQHILALAMTADIKPTDTFPASTVLDFIRTSGKTEAAEKVFDNKVTCAGIFNRLSQEDVTTFINGTSDKITAVIAESPELLRPDIRTTILSVSRLLRYVQNVPEQTMEKAPHKTKLVINYLLKGVQTNTADAKKSIQDIITHASSPFQRTLALSMLNKAPDANMRTIFESALHDPNPWIQRAAFLGMINSLSTDDERRPFIINALQDADAIVACTAAANLLQKMTPYELQHLDWKDAFRYESLSIPNSSYGYSSDMPTKQSAPPGIMEAIRKRMALLNGPEGMSSVSKQKSKASPKNDGPSVSQRNQKAYQKDLKELLTTLLIQYGDKSAALPLLEEWKAKKGEPSSLLDYAIIILQDDEFFPVLESQIKKAGRSWEARKLLSVIQYSNTSAARKLRREINNKMRTMED